MDDPRFGLVKEALAAYASDADDPPVREGEFLQAAVSLIVRGREDLDVLLIKRARRQGDPWSGHMALPGGRRSPEDASLLDTAVRETLEETGVDLNRSGVHLGRLGGVAPQSVHLPRLSIAPFVFGVPHDTPAYVASSKEVDQVHWVPLALLASPSVRSTLEIQLPTGFRQKFPSLNVSGEVVWGLTYRILTDFLDHLPAEPFRGQATRERS